MRITVRLFAILREKAGTSELLLELPSDTTAQDAKKSVADKFPSIAGAIEKAAVAVNMEYVSPDRRLSEGDELALIPPVSGGTNDDWVAIVAEPISAEKGIQFVSHESAGGIAVFLGTTRTETAADGRTLIALDYEAYQEMALRQLNHLARDARAKWPVTKLALLHRIGRVAAGEPSVFVAVSTPHRAEAFEACRWLIDTLKADAAIWKKEIWSDGAARWVGHD